MSSIKDEYKKDDMTTTEETVSLLEGRSEINMPVPVPVAAPTQSTIWRIGSFAVNSSLIAIHMIGNGLILSSLGPTEQAASSLISAVQSFVSGTIFGFLLSTGVELGAALGKKSADVAGKDYSPEEEVEAIIKTSWVVGYSLCLLGTAGFLSTLGILPKIVDPETGAAVGQFFLMFSTGAFSEPMSGNNGLIIAQVEKNMILPLIIAAAYRLPAIGLGYLFSKTVGMGIKGLGLGSAIAGVASLLFSQVLFSRKKYEKFNLSKFSFPDFGRHLKTYLHGGWKLSLQRITEWGNLVAITTVIGAIDNSSLRALQPAIQANTLIGLAMQGMGQAAMMFVVQDCEKQKAHYRKFLETGSKFELEKFKELIDTNKRTFIKNNAFGLVLTTLLAGAIYLARDLVIGLFLGSQISQEQYQLTSSLLLATLIGLIPDSFRIVSGGILRGWGDLLFPTIVSLIMMTVLGVPAGMGITYAVGGSILPIMWARAGSILLSSIFNFYRFYQHIRDDNQLYMDGNQALETGHFSKAITTAYGYGSFFHRAADLEENQVVTQTVSINFE